MELSLKLPALRSHRFTGPIFGTPMTSMSPPQNLRLLRPLRIPPRPPPFSRASPISQSPSRIRNPRFRIRASSPTASPQAPSKPGSVSIAVSYGITVVLAVANRVLYKLALVPLKQYPFFLAQFTTFGYVFIYFSILFIRYRAGNVTDEMLAIPKSPFVAIGILEALGVASGMASAAMLPGPAIPILNQTFLVWQLTFAALLLRRRYSINQIVGCVLVAFGVVLAVASGSNSDQLLSGTAFMWPTIMIVSSAFQAGASILKEFVFIDAATRLKGKLLDIFVVNSFGSGLQALFVLLFLPLLSNFKGIPFSKLPSYLKSGIGCFLNIGFNTPGCDGAPLLPLLYITCNIAFNISMLHLLKISSAIVSSFASTLSVPIAIYVLSLSLPYLPKSSSLGHFFLIGSMILISGLVLYNLPQPNKQGSKVV